MMRSVLSIPLFFIAIALKAQLIITSADMPNPKDSICINVAYSIDSSDLVHTGANYKWNFSNLESKKKRYEVFDAPPFKSPYHFLFNGFNTSYAKNNYHLTGTPIKGLTIEVAYDFFKESTTQYKQIGAAYTINGIPLPFFYAQPDVIYNFPVKYLNVDSCDYKFSLQMPKQGYYSQTGHRVNTVDGWGELKTPYGTFQTLRIKSTIATVDTLYIDTLKSETKIFRPLRYEYKWFTNNMKIPVLQVDAFIIDKKLVITSVQYRDSIKTTPLEIKKNNLNTGMLQVYPNPAGNFLTVNYFLPTQIHAKVYLTDVLGKTILVLQEEKILEGHQQHFINTASIKAGIYFLTLSGGKEHIVKKIIISH